MRLKGIRSFESNGVVVLAIDSKDAIDSDKKAFLKYAIRQGYIPESGMYKVDTVYFKSIDSVSSDGSIICGMQNEDWANEKSGKLIHARQTTKESRSFKALLESHKLIPEGWELDEVKAVAPNGVVILGTIKHKDQPKRVFRAVIPGGKAFDDYKKENEEYERHQNVEWDGWSRSYVAKNCNANCFCEKKPCYGCTQPKQNFTLNLTWTGNLETSQKSYTLERPDVENAQPLNPAEVSLANISAAHMSEYVQLCKLHKVTLLEYKDTPSASLEKGGIRNLKLYPAVTIENPESEYLARTLHKQALEYNFYAHQVKFPVYVTPTVLK
jgi:organic hydroperoxide reductase OsmC/OhrA